METRKLSLQEMEMVEGGVSTAAWGCGISLGIVGGLWSTAAGMVSAGAGFVVGMAWTIAAIKACGDL